MSEINSWSDGIIKELPTVLWVGVAMLVAAEIWLLNAVPEIKEPLLLLLGAVITRIRTPRQ